MENTTFDKLTKGVGHATTRRRALLGLAGGALSLGLAKNAIAQSADEVEATKKGELDERCFRNTDCAKGLKCKGGNPDRDEEGRCKCKNNSGNEGDCCEKNNDCKNGFKCNKNKNKCKRDNNN